MMFINPKAGALKGLTNPAEIKARLNHFGLSPDVTLAKSSRGMAAFIRQVKLTKPNSVLIAGGDGTIGTIVKGLVGEKLDLGLVPIGSINNFGGSLGIENDIDKALDVIASGRASDFDIGKVGNDYFIEAAGIGLIANIFDQTDWDKEKKIVQMVRTTVEQVVSPDPIKVKVNIDDRDLSFETVWLTVANNCKVGAFTLDPNSRLDDGWLELIYCKPLELSELPKYAASFVKGDHLQEDKFVSIKAKRIKLMLPRRTIVHIDDKILQRTRLEFSIVAGALRIFTP